MSPSRIDELRRRVQNDPASIAFAQLAEEYRRSGQTDEAVRVCREGLTRHPGYLSARVTLGRSLLDLGDLADARGEFEFVVSEAPENLAAVRGLAEIYQRDGNLGEALNYYRRALALARHDPEIEEIVQQLSRQIGVASAGDSSGLSFEEAHRELLSAAERVPVVPTTSAAPPSLEVAHTGSTAPFDFDRLVAALGSPAAPAQVEAAVEGRAAFVPISIPETVHEDVNPFAALEAELRAHEVPVAPDIPVASPSDPVEDVPAEVAEAAPDASQLATLAAELESFAVAGHDARHDQTPTEPTPAAAADTLMDAGPWAGLLDTTDGHAPPVVPMDAGDVAHGVPSATPSAAGREDVLGDLESWLNTLHDRTNG